MNDMSSDRAENPARLMAAKWRAPITLVLSMCVLYITVRMDDRADFLCSRSLSCSPTAERLVYGTFIIWAVAATLLLIKPARPRSAILAVAAWAISTAVVGALLMNAAPSGA